MPIYEYKCTACGVTQEVIQSHSDKPLKKCQKCSGALEKLISRSSFQLKGTGWYVSDYGRKSGGSDSRDSSSKEPSKESSKESSSKESSKESSSKDTSSKPSASDGQKPAKKPKSSSDSSGD